MYEFRNAGRKRNGRRREVSGIGQPWEETCARSNPSCSKSFKEGPEEENGIILVHGSRSLKFPGRRERGGREPCDGISTEFRI